MISNKEISTIVENAVRDVLPKARISKIDIKDDMDSTDEQPSLAIVVVFANGQTVQISGRDFLSLHEAIQRKLLEVGEDRYPFLRYAGEREFKKAVSQ